MPSIVTVEVPVRDEKYGFRTVYLTWPDGTKRTRDVYANTEEECEKLLATMITEMKTAVATEKERLRAENRAS